MRLFPSARRIPSPSIPPLAATLSLTFALSLALAATVAAQPADGPTGLDADDLRTAETLRDAALRGSPAFEIVDELTTTIGPRLAGTEADHRGVAWAEAKMKALGFDSIGAALNLADTDRYWTELGDLLAPLGHVGLIVEPRGELRIGDPYKAKSIGIHWEMMFARPRFRTADMGEQGALLDRVADLIDAGDVRGTLTGTLSPINAANLREAHRRLESGTTIGKLVLAGW